MKVPHALAWKKSRGARGIRPNFDGEMTLGDPLLLKKY
jgi:hypothetical protein